MVWPMIGWPGARVAPSLKSSWATQTGLDGRKNEEEEEEEKETTMMVTMINQSRVGREVRVEVVDLGGVWLW